MKKMSKSQNEDVSYTILLGSLALVALTIIMGMDDFIDFLFARMTWYFMFFLFLYPSVRMIINRRFQHEYIIPFTIGLITTTIYAILSNMTPKDIVSLFLQAMVIVSVFSAFFTGFKESVKR
jgi:high-affinity K+ transport system ATPase subunit B